MAFTSDIQSYCTYFLIWLISILLIGRFFKKRTKLTPTHLSLPPSPPSIPILGHIHHLSPSIHKSFHKLSSKYGPLLYIRLGSSPLLLVSSASMVAEIFKTHDVEFASRPRSALSDTFIFGESGFAFAPYGDHWRFMKKLSVTKLLGTKQLGRSKNIRLEELELFIGKILDKVKNNEVVDMEAEMMTLTNNTTCRMVMSTRCFGKDNEAEKVRELLKETFELLAKASFINMLGPLRKLGFLLCRKQKLDILRRYDELFEIILEEHEEKGKRGGVSGDDKDMMDLLLEVYHDQDAEVNLSRFNMKAFFLDLFIAGTSSIADGMQWVLAVLINHPNVLKKVREEIESVVGSNRLVEESDIPNLHYLQAVVKETQRLFPGSTLIVRASIEDCKVGNFYVPKDTTTYINLYSIMMDPKIWDCWYQIRFLPKRGGELGF